MKNKSKIRSRRFNSFLNMKNPKNRINAPAKAERVIIIEGIKLTLPPKTVHINCTNL